MSERNEPSTSSGVTHKNRCSVRVEQYYSSPSESEVDEQENEDDYEDISDSGSAMDEVDEEFYDTLDEEDEPEANAENDIEAQAQFPKRKYALKKWTREAVFETELELSEYFQRNSFWRKTTQYNTKFGVKKMFYCNLQSEKPGERCPKTMYLLTLDGTFQIFQSDEQHSHRAERAKSNPLKIFVKNRIEELYLQNLMLPLPKC